VSTKTRKRKSGDRTQKGGSKRKLKINILVSTLDRIGGTERQSRLLAEELAKRNKVKLVTRRDPGFPKEGKQGKAKIVRVSTINISILRFLSHIKSGLSSIKRDMPDINLCMMLYPNGLIGVLAKKLFKVPTVAWVRGGDWYFGKDSKIKGLIIAYVIRNSDLILVQTEGIRKEVAKRFPKAKIEVIGNGVQLKKTKARGDEILFIGNLLKRKGVEYLIDAVNELPVKTTIIGDGPERQKLERLSSNKKTRFLGRLGPEKLKKHYKSAAVLVLPAASGEGLPNVILEAMSYGLPVVSTKIAGIPDIVKDGKTGILVEPKDSQALRTTIEALIKDKKKRDSMSKKALKDIKNYSFSKQAKRLEDVLMPLTAK